MALTKITSNLIGSNAISAGNITDASITADDLHATLDLTGKTVTVATASAGDNDTSVASTAFVKTAIDNIIDGAPAGLNTLNEIAASLNDDTGLNTTLVNSIATKAPLANPDFTGQLQVSNAATTIQEFTVTGNNTRSTLRLNSKDSSGNSVDLRMHSLGDGPRGEIFTHSNHDLGFATNNAAPQMILKTDGKVGIGETDPKGWLHIKEGDSGLSGSVNSNFDQLVLEDDSHCGMTILSSTGGDGGIYFGDSGGNNRGQFKYRHSDDSFGFITADGAGYALVLKSNDEAIFGSKVGIGETSPDGLLHLKGGTATGDASHILFENTQGSKVFAIGGGSTGITNNNLFFRNVTDNTRPMVITDAGNVGIGTDSPATTLQVKKAGDGTLVRLSSSGVCDWDLSIGNSSTLSGVGAGALELLPQNANSANEFAIGQAGTTARLFHLTNSQNYFKNKVGIGETSPETELHVKGSNNSAGDLYTAVGPGNIPSITIQNAGTTDNNNAALFFRDDQDMRGSVAMRFTGHSTHESELRFSTTTGNNTREKFLMNGQGIFMAGGTTLPTYPGAVTTARTGNAGTTTQATWGFNSSAGGSSKDFGFKASGTGSYAYGVINAAETTWMSRLGFDGRIYLTNTTVGSISDRRLKENIVDANSQWNDIKALRFKNYTWKDTVRGTGTYLGLIADEVKLISPSLVEIEYQSPETLPEDGIDPEYEGVKYSIVWMKAVKALQEAMTKIETLETKLEAAEARIATLEG